MLANGGPYDPGALECIHPDLHGHHRADAHANWTSAPIGHGGSLARSSCAQSFAPFNEIQ